MTNEKISIVFFGSGPVAKASLELLKQNFIIEAVVTKATTISDMASVIDDSKVYAVSDKLELDALFTTKKFKSSVGILIDFGIIVSNKIIDYFDAGIINSHFSLLPELRGADPISFAILEGKNKTGVSLMVLVEGMDEGPIIATIKHKLSGHETTPELTRSLVELSYNLINESIDDYLSGELKPVEQEIIKSKLNLEQSYTRKLTKLDGKLDWTKTAETLEREIRGYADWPKSYTTLGSIDCVIIKAVVSEKPGESGEVLVEDKRLYVFCKENALEIQEIKPAGKKEMNVVSFLAGYRSRLGLDR